MFAHSPSRIAAVTTPGTTGAETSKETLPYLWVREFVCVVTVECSHRIVNVELMVAPSATTSFTPPFVFTGSFGRSRYSWSPPSSTLYEPSALTALNGAFEYGLRVIS